MRLKLTLKARETPSFLPFNYQYPLSSAIYKIIESASREFAEFLHDKGYGSGNKRFKLFTFSDIKTRFTKNGDRMQMVSGEAELIVCFYLPVAAENFVKGLFINQRLEVADKKSRTVFHVQQVESLPDIYNSADTYVLQPLSPVVVGAKNDRGHYDYRSPQDEDFVEWLLNNWKEKFVAGGNTDVIHFTDPSVKVRLFNNPPKSRLVTIKSGTDAETKIRGYTNFRLEVTASESMLAIALGAGLGLHNSQGFGCVEIV